MFNRKLCHTNILKITRRRKANSCTCSSLFLEILWWWLTRPLWKIILLHKLQNYRSKWLILKNFILYVNVPLTNFRYVLIQWLQKNQPCYFLFEEQTFMIIEIAANEWSFYFESLHGITIIEFLREQEVHMGNITIVKLQIKG